MGSVAHLLFLACFILAGIEKREHHQVTGSSVAAQYYFIITNVWLTRMSTELVIYWKGKSLLLSEVKCNNFILFHFNHFQERKLSVLSLPIPSQVLICTMFWHCTFFLVVVLLACEKPSAPCSKNNLQPKAGLGRHVEQASHADWFSIWKHILNRKCLSFSSLKVNWSVCS